MRDYLRCPFVGLPPSGVQLEIFTDAERVSRPRPQCLIQLYDYAYDLAGVTKLDYHGTNTAETGERHSSQLTRR